MKPVAAFALAVASAAAPLACSSPAKVDSRTAEDRGRLLFENAAAAAPSRYGFACATCHRAERDPADARILPGADLAGVVLRETYWGGAERELLRAINHCRFYFMDAQTTWSEADEDAKAMYVFLAALPAAAPQSQPFTIRPVASDLPPGDASEGERVYQASCSTCHGAVHTGERRIGTIPVLPDESVASFATFGFNATETRITFVEKVRHGGFLGLYGNMPPYSVEALSDAQLSSLLAFLKLFP